MTIPDATLQAPLRKNYESDVCGSLPIHQINQVQPYGVLLVIDRDTQAIIQASELAPAGGRSFVSTFQDIRRSMAAIDAAQTTTEACAAAARELKRLSGFDKVMVYRFDEDWNGYVEAEEMEEGMESYLGFTFPARIACIRYNEREQVNALHPRASFRQWRRRVSGTSLPWRPEELTIAENLRTFIHEYLHNHYLA